MDAYPSEIFLHTLFVLTGLGSLPLRSSFWVPRIHSPFARWPAAQQGEGCYKMILVSSSSSAALSGSAARRRPPKWLNRAERLSRERQPDLTRLSRIWLGSAGSSAGLAYFDS